ncbi:amino acid ABC transporter [Atlantibacter subterranea]|jgi:polar amino acid transport system substrate-binding protein|uniref:Amino acid ABC transporter n=1 Tax=Atlantibacter subterraneus TaxID=255519 RepID=A0A427V096_9ENTR|nr:transporter substrate-binding domain-containing protein [Atlantibacter subterranea]MDZ5665917.1 transporter substrate-binding domain-containing protein [Atlantibacter hermannii]MDA3131845.1 transporter substrate-binding domain-containing protein [Atlantibacter subterranea]MDV7022719.1 transporter substrate-binding domain-containing protein [Atlantibacter subterranea]RSB62221.1 amino acid ABC transporter [Atlantibacter subterranea]RSE06963.1 amino acid ABC transporter [Atlantibacter subterra
MSPAKNIVMLATLLSAVVTLPVSANALEEIQKRGEIRVATDLSIPPSGMLDASMKPVGSDVETAELLAKDWGLKLKFIETTGATRIPNLQTGKADIVISTLSVTPQRAQVIDFSRAYAGLRSVIGAPAATKISDWADLKGHAITVTRGTTQDSMLTKDAAKNGITIQRYDDDATMVTAAVSGQAYAVATSATLVNQINKQNPKLAFEPKMTLTVFDLAIGLKKNEPELKAKLDEWIAANLKNGKLNAIYEKYHGEPIPAEILNRP